MAREQAEAHVEVLADMMASHFATTQDLKDLESRMDFKFRDLESRMNERFHNVDLRFTALESKIENLEHRLTIKLSGIMAALIGAGLAVATLIKLL